MLQVSYIRDNREQVLERLAVKNFKQPELVDDIIQLDEKRRQTQNLSDNVSAQANAAAKQVGELMRAGKKDEAEAIKAKTGTWKEEIKILSDVLSATEAELREAQKSNNISLLFTEIVDRSMVVLLLNVLSLA